MHYCHLIRSYSFSLQLIVRYAVTGSMFINVPAKISTIARFCSEIPKFTSSGLRKCCRLENECLFMKIVFSFLASQSSLTTLISILHLIFTIIGNCQAFAMTWVYSRLF